MIQGKIFRPTVQNAKFNLKKNFLGDTKLKSKSVEDESFCPPVYERFLSLSTGVSSIHLQQTTSTTKTAVIDIWHSRDECDTCNDILRIKTENMDQLQHHFKFCTTYSIFFALIEFVEVQIGQDTDQQFIEESPNITYPKRARSVCERAMKKWKEISAEFKQAADLSDQLTRPDQSACYNCDDYKNHLNCLLKIAHVVDGPEEDIVSEINNALLPYDQSSGISDSEMSIQQKWEKTYANLKHDKGDHHLGETLRKMLKYGTVFPPKYSFTCHKK